MKRAILTLFIAGALVAPSVACESRVGIFGRLGNLVPARVASKSVAVSKSVTINRTERAPRRPLLQRRAEVMLVAPTQLVALGVPVQPLGTVQVQGEPTCCKKPGVTTLNIPVPPPPVREEPKIRAKSEATIE